MGVGRRLVSGTLPLLRRRRRRRRRRRLRIWHVPRNYSNNKTILIIISTSVWEHTALRRARVYRNGKREAGRRKRAGEGERRGEERRGHNDRGRIMTIITIYMQVPSLPAHEQSTHSISYLIWIIQTNLSFLPSFLCTLYNPNKRDETSTVIRFFSTTYDSGVVDSFYADLTPCLRCPIAPSTIVSLSFSLNLTRGIVIFSLPSFFLF